MNAAIWIVFLSIFAVIGLFAFDNPVKCSFVDCPPPTNINIVNVNASGSGGAYNVSYESTYNVTYEKAYNVSYESMYNQSYEINWGNVAFLNNTQNFTAQNTFRDSIFLGWLNASNQTVWSVLNNVSSKGYINASGFNATSWSLFGNINASGFINSTSFLMGTMCNASTFNATSSSIFGNINVSGYVNATSFVTGTMGNFSFMNASNTITSYYDNSTFQNATKNVTGSSIGVMMVNQTAAGYYPALVLLFDNETEVSGTTVQWLNFTLPAANQFSRIIVRTQWTILGTAATAYNWVIEMAIGGVITHDANITASGITADTFRDEGMFQGGSTTTTGKVTVKLYPVVAGGATVELQSLQVFAVT